MKITPHQIFEPGLLWIRNTSPVWSDNLSFACSVSIKIGYIHFEGEIFYGYSSVFTDNWFCKIGTKLETTEYLIKQKYRQMTEEEAIKLFKYFLASYCKK